MQNYRFVLEYDGTRYNGWQRLGDTDNTVQTKLETVLSRMSGQEVQVIGAGRTDAGVHARGQAANAHIETERSPEEIRAYLNHYLPEDIRVREIKKAAERFHSRYNAIEKRYCYYVGTGEKAPVFQRRYRYQLGCLPDLAAMRRAAEALTGTHDFMSFCANKRMKKSTVRSLYELRIDYSAAEELLTFTYRGDGFLYHMIRILTGTLLEVGTGKRDADSMGALLSAKDRAKAGCTVPPHGLFLEEVKFGESKAAGVC